MDLKSLQILEDTAERVHYWLNVVRVILMKDFNAKVQIGLRLGDGMSAPWWDILIYQPNGLKDITGSGDTIANAYQACVKQLTPIDKQLSSLEETIHVLTAKRDALRKQNETTKTARTDQA